MKRKDFITKFEELRAETILDGNCGDIDDYIGRHAYIYFSYLFNSDVFNDEGFIVGNNIERLFWLKHGLDSWEALSIEEQNTQRVVCFELFYSHVLTNKSYKEW